MNFKIILEYDGTKYNGWQRQGNTDNTIQGKLEDILSKYFEQPIEIHGSGRTDAGVHALGQVANFKVSAEALSNIKFDYETDIYSKVTSDDIIQNQTLLCSIIQKNLNSYLPEDIRITSINVADDRFHARLNAKNKTYRYRWCLSYKKNVFERKYCASLAQVTSFSKRQTCDTYNYITCTMLDIDAMKTASLSFLGEHDFIGFSDTKTKKSTIRRVDNISFTQETIDNCDYLTVDFTGNGFLYHTVRLMMGTLIQIGLGKCSPFIIEEILESKERKKVPYMAPAEGLFLVKVGY